MVDPGALIDCRQHPYRERDRDREGEGEQHELQRDRQGFGQERVHRAARNKGAAEVAVQDELVEPPDILFHDGSVEAVVLLELGDLRIRRLQA